MFEWLLQTDSGVVGLILRLTLAVVMFPHGAQKMLGWFGGHGFKNTIQFFTSSGIPAGLALLAIAAEFLGSLGLAVGLLTRVAAFGIACVMLVAIATVHWSHGFFMNWSGDQRGGRPARRGLRVPPAGTGHCALPDHQGRGRLVGGWPSDRRWCALAELGRTSRTERPYFSAQRWPRSMG
jgi:putative oxidoreductase